MQKLIYSAAIFIIFNFSIMAQKGFDLTKEIIINVPASELWETVGPGFVEVYKWSSNVDHAEGAGSPEFEGAVCSERFCDVNVKGFNKISEKLTKYDELSMNLAYEVMDGMPSFVTKASNDWTVVKIDEERSKLIMKASFRSKGILGSLMNGVMKTKMEKTLETVLNDAKVYVETGQISSAKQARIDELAKKQKRLREAA